MVEIITIAVFGIASGYALGTIVTQNSYEDKLERCNENWAERLRAWQQYNRALELQPPQKEDNGRTAEV